MGGRGHAATKARRQGAEALRKEIVDRDDFSGIYRVSSSSMYVQIVNAFIAFQRQRGIQAMCIAWSHPPFVLSRIQVGAPSCARECTANCLPWVLECLAW